ncbi:MAG TPA: hypothetical protein VIO38_05915 [Rariglobus sp.]
MSKAKAQFSGIARRVIKTKKGVIVSTPTGSVQIIPYDVPEYVPPSEKGAFTYSADAIRLANTFGESL